MTPYPGTSSQLSDIEAAAWQQSWDRQQEAFMPDREERFRAMLDVVDAVTAGQPLRVLDLAGGTGSISLRALRRFPDLVTTLLDVDPVLLAIARPSLPERSTVVRADLRDPEWSAALPHREYDAVLTATALHWLSPERQTALYAEIREVLRSGGVLINTDHMPDDGLPGLTERLGARFRARREALYAAGAVLSWEAWWEQAATDPRLGPLVAERKQIFADRHGTEWSPPAAWHLAALRDAGFREVGLVWRGARDAAAAAVR